MTAKETIRLALQMTYDWTIQLADDLADAPLTAPTPRGGNHPLWVVGHLAHARRGLLGMMTGEVRSDPQADALFAGGTEPRSAASAYPPYAEVLAQYRAVHTETLAVVDRWSDAQLDERPSAIPQEFKDEPYFQTNGKLLLFIALHEMSHRGQLADARRTLGRDPFM